MNGTHLLPSKERSPPRDSTFSLLPIERIGVSTASIVQVRHPIQHLIPCKPPSLVTRHRAPDFLSTTKFISHTASHQVRSAQVLIVPSPARLEQLVAHNKHSHASYKESCSATTPFNHNTRRLRGRAANFVAVYAGEVHASSDHCTAAYIL